MRIGQHEAVRGDDQPGADALGLVLLHAAILPEVLVVDRVVLRHRFLGVDVDHGGLDVGNDLDDRFVGDIDLARRGRDLALRSGQRTMSLYDLPSHRILFMEDVATKKISVWVD